MDPVRRSYGSRTGSARESPVLFSYPTGPVRGLQGCRLATVYARKRIDTTRICKNPAGASYVAVQFPRALHSALRPMKRTGAKIRAGLLAECDWGMRQYKWYTP